MLIKKIVRRVILLLLLAVLGYGVYYVWFSFPIISGFSAKNGCSCAFIQGRKVDDIKNQELGSLPLSLGNITINYKDSSVTGTVFGFAKRKAIYRKGFGCTLVNGISGDNLRKQANKIPNIPFDQDSVDWPSGDRLTTSYSPTFDSALSFAFNHRYNDKNVHTRAVLVVHNGKIVAEKYAPGYNKNSMFLGWSMAKSITSALIGILVKNGSLKVSDVAPVKTWSNKNDNRHNITIEHLLQQTSGLDFREHYASYSNVTDMLFNQADMAGFTASLPLKHQPGTEFYYSSGNSNILSGIIRTTVGDNNYHSFPYKALFHKIGMHHTLLEPDASGTFVGSSYVHASARDYARFGLLYLNNGVWNGERILPEDWVKKTVTAPSVNTQKNYGYQFWLNSPDQKNKMQREFPEAPADMFYADGYGGQRIYIIPSLQLVIVRLGLNKFDEQQFLKEIIRVITQ